MAALLLLSGPRSGTRVELETELTLGRSPSCDVPLEDSKVSRRHAWVELRLGVAYLSDLGSRNGTTFAGEALSAEQALRPGDHFQVGETEVVFESSAAPVPAVPSGFDETTAEGLIGAEEAAGLTRVLGSVGAAPSAGALIFRAVAVVAERLGAVKAGAWLGVAEATGLSLREGTEPGDVPRALVEAVAGRNLVAWSGGMLGAPLAAKGEAAMGCLFVIRGKPFDEAERRWLAAAAREIAAAYGALRGFALVLPAVPVMVKDETRERFERVRVLAQGVQSVLFTGENGSGKRFLAEYLHSRSMQADGGFVVVDCRSPAAVLDEKLFGRPAAPGVPGLKPGLARAERGTFVLHRVEALTRSFAERVARAVSTRSVRSPEGVELPIDARIVLTSSLSKVELRMPGQGATELLGVLAPEEISIPALRTTPEEVPELFAAFVGRVTSRMKGAPPRLTPEARRLLTIYAWPGNAEEVRLCAGRVGLLFAGQEVTALCLPPEIREASATEAPRSLQDRVAGLERDAILEALREARGKKIRAAALLGISRPTLDKKIEDYGLVVEKVREFP